MNVKQSKEWLCDRLPNSDSTDDTSETLLCLQFPKISPGTFMYTTKLWKSILEELTKGDDNKENKVTLHILPALLTFTLEPPRSWLTDYNNVPPPLSYTTGTQHRSLFKK